jgi:hypothetical protein
MWLMYQNFVSRLSFSMSELSQPSSVNPQGNKNITKKNFSHVSTTKFRRIFCFWACFTNPSITTWIGHPKFHAPCVSLVTVRWRPQPQILLSNLQVTRDGFPPCVFISWRTVYNAVSIFTVNPNAQILVVAAGDFEVPTLWPNSFQTGC